MASKIREQAEELICYKLAQKVTEILSEERIGVNEHFEPAMMEFFINHIMIGFEDHKRP